MKKNLFAIITIVLVIAILSGSIWAMFHIQNKYKEAQKKKVGPRNLAVTVQTGTVQRHRIDEVLTFNGDIQPMQTVDLQPKISGRLLTLALKDGTPVEEGTKVKKGELIARFDDRELKAQLANAQAAMAAAKAAQAATMADQASYQAGILNAKATLEQRLAAKSSAEAATTSAKAAKTDKERELARQKNLLQNQATTQQNYDQAMTAFDQAEAALTQAEASELAAAAQVKSAEAAILQSEAALERCQASLQQAEAAQQQAAASLLQAEVVLSETEIFAPMDGIVTRKYTDPGSMLSPSTTIVTIMAMEEVKVLLFIPVNHLPRIKPGQTQARMRTPSLPGEVINCSVAKVYPAIDINTRTAQVEMRVQNRVNDYGSYKLKPGMYATVEVLIESRENVIAIDSALPIRSLDRNIVYVANGKEQVTAVNVKLGTRFESKVEVLAGLQEGDEVVVVGQHRLTDGALIKRLQGNNLDF